MLALENEWPRRFDSTLIVVDVNYIVLLECALMHTEDADFANEGVVDDFEDLSNERQILIWVGFEWRAIAFDEQRISIPYPQMEVTVRKSFPEVKEHA